MEDVKEYLMEVAAAVVADLEEEEDIEEVEEEIIIKEDITIVEVIKIDIIMVDIIQAISEEQVEIDMVLGLEVEEEALEEDHLEVEVDNLFTVIHKMEEVQTINR